MKNKYFVIIKLLNYEYVNFSFIRILYLMYTLFNYYYLMN